VLARGMRRLAFRNWTVAAGEGGGGGAARTCGYRAGRMMLKGILDGFEEEDEEFYVLDVAYWRS
jgi:hypothetical protein